MALRRLFRATAAAAAAAKRLRVSSVSMSSADMIFLFVPSFFPVAPPQTVRPGDSFLLP